MRISDWSSDVCSSDLYRAGLEEGVRGLRIAVPENYFYDKVDPAVEKLLRESLEVFRSLGAEIVPVTIPSIELANPAGMIITQAESASFHGQWLRERPQDYGQQTHSRMCAGQQGKEACRER